MSILQGVQFQKYHKWLSRKGLDPEFEFKKLGFVQEACGKQQEEHVVNAQSTVNNARKNSLAAAFNLFATNLTNDQCLQDKFLAMAEMTNSRARSVLIHGLEAFGCDGPHQEIWGYLGLNLVYVFEPPKYLNIREYEG